MRRNNELIIAGPENSDQKTLNETYWQGFNEPVLFFNLSVQEPVRYLAELVLEIQQHPKNLTAHIERIVICYRENLIEPLYAALLDFLIVLNQRGSAISRRMVGGALSKLTDRQRALLLAAINKEINDVSLIEGNSFSIFCRGLSGTLAMIEKLSKKEFTDSDSLKLAQDAVEYSQLDEAMLILENAIYEQPHKVELHEFLLELYKSTLNRARFEATFARLLAMESVLVGYSLQQSWSQLEVYFDQMCHE